MHRVLLREVVIDVPHRHLDRTRQFWAGALGAESRPSSGYPEFIALDHPAALPHVGLQDVGDAPARFHLDIETDDVEAEVARLAGLGAVEQERHHDWVVMADPAGLLFCVLPPESDEFDARSREVSDHSLSG